MTREKDQFSVNLTRIRRAHGLNQEQIARILGIKRSRYAAWEEKRALPIASMLLKISEKFNIPVEKLIGIKVRVSQVERSNHDDNFLIKYQAASDTIRRAVDILLGID